MYINHTKLLMYKCMRYISGFFFSKEDKFSSIIYLSSLFQYLVLFIIFFQVFFSVIEESAVFAPASFTSREGGLSSPSTNHHQNVPAHVVWY